MNVTIYSIFIIFISNRRRAKVSPFRTLRNLNQTFGQQCTTFQLYFLPFRAGGNGWQYEEIVSLVASFRGRKLYHRTVWCNSLQSNMAACPRRISMCARFTHAALRFTDQMSHSVILSVVLYFLSALCLWLIATNEIARCMGQVTLWRI